MMKQRKPLYFVLCLMVGVWALSGCIEKYEADISSEDSDLLVVEGTICSGEMNRFILSRTQPIGNNQDDTFIGGWNTSIYSSLDYYSPRLVRGATVSVRGSDGSEYMTENTSGYYTCQLDSLNPDVEYYLHIETDGEVYESEPQKPLRTEKIADVSGAQANMGSKIDVLVTPDAPFDSDKGNYYSWTYDETWEVYPEHTTAIYFDVDLMMPIRKPDLFPLRGWKTATSSTIMIGASTNYEGQHIQRVKLYDIDNHDERLYYKYSGQVHQRAITKAEYEYELARRQAGSEMGGLFTPLPSALPTNIRCLTSKKQVIGFVGCSLNTSDFRFFFHAADFFVVRPAAKEDFIWLYGCDEVDCCNMVKNGMFLIEWLDNRMMIGGRLSTSWAYQYQLDVRLHGAFTTEPDFWRDDEEDEDSTEFYVSRNT